MGGPPRDPPSPPPKPRLMWSTNLSRDSGALVGVCCAVHGAAVVYCAEGAECSLQGVRQGKNNPRPTLTHYQRQQHKSACRCQPGLFVQRRNNKLQTGCAC